MDSVFTADYINIAIVAILAFCILGLFMLLRGIIAAIAETAAVRRNTAALMTGVFVAQENIKHITRIKRRGLGLRVKLMIYTEALILLVVIIVSVPFYRMTFEIQRETLLKSLWERSTVLLDGLAANTVRYLSQGNTQDLAALPALMHTIEEALYVTITEYNPDSSVYDEFVWASNDPGILQKIDTLEFQPGVSRLSDPLSPRLLALSVELNAQAQRRVGLGPEISAGILSEPPDFLMDFKITADRQYTFFMPVLYHYGSEDDFFRGIVRLEVSIYPILNDLDAERRNIFIAIVMYCLAAMLIGFLGSLLLSGLHIRPINQLVKHVEIIRDTHNKARLDGKNIIIKSNDELGLLGDTINEMTHGLVRAALADSDLSIGKEIQKKFLPLELDSEGKKLSYGLEDTKYLSFFGYYEGAKGVSGDYFDYQDLDGRYYAIIKCDVAGKGIPAAFIMIQVATMFINYFKYWVPTEQGLRIDELTYEINGFIETLGFQGRFAAFTLCLYDSHTGLIRFCNAGDNIVRIFDASEGKVKTIVLPQTPAAGVLPNSEIESRGGYKVQNITLDHGDILLLYTDGIEESKRKFRNESFQEIVYTEGPHDTFHRDHFLRQEDEEMGCARVLDIVNAAMNKEIYTLHKSHNPEGEDKDLQFDFRSSQGTVEEVIMAMISVEKMFRCYKDPKATEDDQVLVDKKVDVFLKKHLIQYLIYGFFSQEIPGNEGHIYYTHTKEDEQYDDLTILGLSRK